MKVYGYIYITTCLITNKIYIGQHKSKVFTKYLGSGKIVKQAIKKYGRKNFTVELICWCASKKDADEKEKVYIKEYNAQDPEIGMNISDGGDGGSGPRSDDSKERSRLAQLKVWTPEKCKEHGLLFKGENHPNYGKPAWNSGKHGLQKAWNKIYLDKDILYDLFWVQNKSFREIAEILHCSVPSVGRYMKEYKIRPIDMKKVEN